MSICQTTSWSLDCGEGHGCGLAEDSQTGELLGWFCSSTLAVGRRNIANGQARVGDREMQIELCMSNAQPENLANALSQITGLRITPIPGARTPGDFCRTGPLDEILSMAGLTIEA